MSKVYHSLAGGAFTQNWSSTGLITTNDDWSNVPSIEGFLGQDITTATDTDPQTLTTDSALPSDLDVNANQNNPDTFATGGVAEFDGIADPTIALNGSGNADAPHLILYLDTTGVTNVRVQFDARDLDGSIDDATSQLAVQYRVGETGSWINLPSAYISDATTGPSLATLVTPVDVTLPAAAANQPKVQVRIITTNASGTDEWIGIDNISVTAADALPALSINDVSVNEAAGTMTFTVTRTGKNAAPITVDYATADDSAVSVTGGPGTPDFTAESGTITFAPSANATETQTFTVAINSDNVYEAVEQFFVNLSNASGATISDGQGLATINNDDPAPTFSVNDIAANENGTATFTITLTGATALPISVDYQTADGTAVSTTGGPGTPDFTAQSGTLTFNPSASGTQTQTVTVPLNNDWTSEPAEQFVLNLFNATNGSTITDGQGVATIYDPPTLAIDDVSVNEAAGTITFTVTRTGANAAPITVDYATADDSAISTTGGPGTPDFTAKSGTLTFAPTLASTSTQTFTVLIGDDNIYEAVKQFTVSLSNASGAIITDALGVGTITNDDPAPTIAVDDFTIGEDGTATFTVTLTGATALPISVDYATGDGTAVSTTGGAGTPDFTAKSGTLTFNPSASGTQTLTVTVPLNNDTTREPTEQFVLNLFNATNGATITDGQGVATITNDDPVPTYSVNDVTQAEGNSGLTAFVFTVSLSNPTVDTVTISFAAADGTATAASGDYMGPSGSLIFAPGETTKTVTVGVNGDRTFEANETFGLVLTGGTFATAGDTIGVGTIINDESSGFDFDADGKGDILFQNTNGTPAVWLLDGVNVATIGPALANPGPSWHAKTSGDFDGDGKADILWQNDNGTAGVWLMDGVNVKQIGGGLTNPGPSWKAKEAADFDGDGKADILWQNDNGTAGVWLMDGVNVKQIGGGLADVGSAWKTKAAADFNGDGKADILWQNDDGTAGVWLMDGVNVKQVGGGINPGSASWHAEAAGDFNGDGKADILWQHTDGRAAVWLMDGTSVLEVGGALTNPGPTWHVKEAIDANGDGKADILWQNDNGTPGVWLMNGTSVLQTGGGLTNPGPAWHIV